MKDNIGKDSQFVTNESRLYVGLPAHFESLLTAKHSHGEYGRDDIYTNIVEGRSSIFKCGVKVIWRHYAENYSYGYFVEFDLRYKNRVKLGAKDLDRAVNLLRAVVGKRLTYRTIGSRV